MPRQGTRQARKAAEIWADPGRYATTLLVLFVDAYGTEGLGWDNRTIKMEIEDDFGVTLPQGNFDRLMVAKGILTTDDFYRSLPDFIDWCNVLDGGSYDPRVWDPAEAAECAWGITEALLIDEPEEDDPFSPEILGYIGAVLDAEGIINPPDVLAIATGRRYSASGLGDFSDDPEMFDAVWDFEASKTGAINGYVRDSLVRLSRQLDELPLDTGDTTDAVRRMLGGLARKN